MPDIYIYGRQALFLLSDLRSNNNFSVYCFSFLCAFSGYMFNNISCISGTKWSLKYMIILFPQVITVQIQYLAVIMIVMSWFLTPIEIGL
jgi:hypothetical protein